MISEGTGEPAAIPVLIRLKSNPWLFIKKNQRNEVMWLIVETFEDRRRGEG
jgi:hypothetical protein